MPELPEVETTKNGLKRTILGLKIKDVWTDLSTKDIRQKESVANPMFFTVFKKEVLNKKIISVERRAKNILINLSGGKTILIHMKMTGHLLYGQYKFTPSLRPDLKNSKRSGLVFGSWSPVKDTALKDPYNRFVHFVFTFDNRKNLAFSDARKFGKITLLDTKTINNSKHLKNIGPEPLDKNLTLKDFEKRLKIKPNGKVKIVLMDQSIIAGIGNIYSDEILWRTGIHPERKIQKIKNSEFGKMFAVMKKILKKGIDFGGDSMSDYRNIDGEKGKFQLHHKAYRRTGEKCMKNDCKGIIIKKVINGRSAHFCSIHQK